MTLHRRVAPLLLMLLLTTASAADAGERWVLITPPLRGVPDPSALAQQWIVETIYAMQIGCTIAREGERAKARVRAQWTSQPLAAMAIAECRAEPDGRWALVTPPVARRPDATAPRSQWTIEEWFGSVRACADGLAHQRGQRVVAERFVAERFNDAECVSTHDPRLALPR